MVGDPGVSPTISLIAAVIGVRQLRRGEWAQVTVEFGCGTLPGAPWDVTSRGALGRRSGDDADQAKVDEAVVSEIAGQTDLDPCSVAVLEQQVEVSTWPVVGESQRYRLHPAQAGGGDPVVKSAKYRAKTGQFTVPARTVAVFVRR